MITIISGTNRHNSNSLRVAKYYQKQLNIKGVDSRILPLNEVPLSIYSADIYAQPSPDFKPIQDIITQTQKFLFIIPEYNGSFPGVLKALIDVCKFPESFDHKKCALVGIATGKYGNIRGVDHFTGIAHYCGMQVMPLKIHIPAIHTELNDAGDFHLPKTLKFVTEQIDKFADF
jgi:chromate reductase, NAD(P)H dehydrogenase (quinone)